jgi:hypothetical protein
MKIASQEYFDSGFNNFLQDHADERQNKITKKDLDPIIKIIDSIK